MSLRVSTTGSDVSINDLGITVFHPTSNLDLTLQFTANELRDSIDLTNAIASGNLDVDDGANFVHKDDYDPDEFLIQQLGYNKDYLYISHDELASVNDILINKTGVFPLSLNSTATSTRNVYQPGGRFITWQLAIGDIVVISGSTAADGTYTVESITDQQNFIVVEAISNSTGGTTNIYHPGGATKIGIDNSTLPWTTSATDLQGALEDIDFTASGLDIDEHRELDQLVHRISEDSYEEATYNTSNRITALIVWTDTSKVTKIREEQYTYDNSRIATITMIQYNESGTEVERETETIDRVNNKFSSIERTLI